MQRNRFDPVQGVLAPLANRQTICQNGTWPWQPSRIVLVIVLLLLFDSMTVFTTQAHGGGTPRLTDMPVGPYRIFVWSQPEPLRVGEIHLTIGLTVGNELPEAPSSETLSTDRPDQESVLVAPITDATVIVRMVPVHEADGAETDGEQTDRDKTEGSAPAEVIETIAVVSGLGAVYYEADASLPTAGEWRFIIEVSDNAGSSTIEFSEKLLAERTLNLPLLVGAVLLFLLLIGLIGVWNRRQGKDLSATAIRDKDVR